MLMRFPNQFWVQVAQFSSNPYVFQIRILISGFLAVTPAFLYHGAGFLFCFFVVIVAGFKKILLSN